MKLTFRAAERLDDLTADAVEDVAEEISDEHVDAVEARASDLADSDGLLREAVAVEETLDRQANARRKAAADPWEDTVLADLREAREAARSAAERRAAEVAREALAVVDVDDAAAVPAEVSSGE